MVVSIIYFTDQILHSIKAIKLDFKKNSTERLKIFFLCERSLKKFTDVLNKLESH